MPTYYFHLSDDDKLSDADGTNLTDLSEARSHAFAVARELMFRSPGMLDEDWSRWTMVVHDDGVTSCFRSSCPISKLTAPESSKLEMQTFFVPYGAALSERSDQIKVPLI